MNLFFVGGLFPIVLFAKFFILTYAVYTQLGFEVLINISKLRASAISVHMLTATGAVLALLAIEAAVRQAWPQMMLWLVVAFIVDGIDGPLARKFDVENNASEWDGVLMDLIVDYLTYVFIPVFALWQSGLMTHFWGGICGAIICFASVIYFSDTRMKTKDKSFSGFPGCWNMVIVVFFALQPPFWIMLAVIIFLTVAMFLPLKFIHPVRTKHLRPLSLSIAMLWTFAAGYCAWYSFDTGPVVPMILLWTSVYLLLIGLVQQFIFDR